VPGPYDIRTQPITYSERLPVGLGSESFWIANLPAFSAYGAGSLGLRYVAHDTLGVRMGWRDVVGGIFGSKSSNKDVDALQRSLSRAIGGRGGTSGPYAVGRAAGPNLLPRSVGGRVERAANVLFQATRGRLGSQVVAEYVPGVSGAAAAATRAGGGQLEFPFMSSGPPGEQGMFPFMGEKVTPAAAAAESAGGSWRVRVGNKTIGTYGSLEAATARGARVQGRLDRLMGTRAFGRGQAAQAFQALRGVSALMVGLQVGALAADVSRGVGEAALSWRPRRTISPAHEFAMPFVDTGMAMTQRQRAIMAIHDSQLTTRAILGNEAAYMHY